MVDVLNLEWSSSSSRDREMATLVCNYLRFRGYTVREGCIFNGMHLINTLKPKLLFITNSIGAKINLEVVKYAKRRGVRVVTLISEGNFLEGDDTYLKQMIWGWNNDQKYYEDLHLQWSERTKRLTVKHSGINEFVVDNKVGVSGAVGFDVYKIAKGISKADFLSRVSKQGYKKVIGVAGWAFSIFDHGQESAFGHLYSSEDVEAFRSDKFKYSSILKDLIEKNEDILFILKLHPAARSKECSGFFGIEKFGNVVFVEDEFSLVDCLHVSDLWLFYDSTTSIEAWMLGKETFRINPTKEDFYRDSSYLGSLNFRDQETLSRAIRDYYCEQFENKSDILSERSIIIRDVLGWDDGFNHVRAGNSIIETIGSANSISPESFRDFMKRLELTAKFLIKKYIKRQIDFKSSEVKSFAKVRFKEQVNFYKQKKVTNSLLHDLNRYSSK